MAPQADPELTKKLDDLHTQAKSARRLLEPEWFMDLAMYQGQHWLMWANGTLHKPDLAPNRITVTENRIAGVVRTELAKMTKNRPVFVVTPTTGDQEDANAADLAERIVRYQWEHLKMPELALKALEWSRICGAGFLKCYWDPTIGDQQSVLVGPDGQPVPDPQTGRPMRGDEQMAQMFATQFNARVISKTISQGDLRVEVRSPFQMFVDPLCDSFSEAEWVIEESIKSADYVSERYGAKIKPDTPANPGMVEGRMLGAGGAGVAGSGGYNGVRIREYWRKPCAEYPKGARIVWTKQTVLESDMRPFDPMPYVMLTGIPVPGRLWPMSVVDLLRGPNTELNKTLSQMAENRNRVGNPTLLASKQAVQNAEKFQEATMMPGGVYYFDDLGSPNALPTYLQAPSLPDYVVETLQRNLQAIEDISGQHEVTNANVPPGVTAASAITLLQEADDTRLGLAMADYEEQLGRFGSKVLDLVSNFYTDARTIRIAGDDGAWEIFDFKGAMLRGNTHVEVQAGSAFPQSKAAKQAMIQDWMTFFVQSGNAPHGRQLAQFLRDSGMGASDRLVQEYTTDENQVNRENTLLSLGQPLPINDYDNNQAHVDGHTDYQKQPRYASFSPAIKQVFDAHIMAQRQALAQEQQQQMAVQAQAQGQPPPQMAQAQQAADLAGQLQQLQAGPQNGQQQQQQQQVQQGLDMYGGVSDQRRQEELHQQALQHNQERHDLQQQLRRQGASNAGNR
jgi:hypothetical protein